MQTPRVQALAIVAMASLLVSLPAARAEDKLKGPAVLDVDTILVPLRELAGWFGAVVQPALPHITLLKGTLRAELEIGTGSAFVTDAAGNRKFTLARPPHVIGGMTYVPLSFFAQAFGDTIKYSEADGVLALSTANRAASLPLSDAAQWTGAKVGELQPGPVSASPSVRGAAAGPVPAQTADHGQGVEPHRDAKLPSRFALARLLPKGAGGERTRVLITTGADGHIMAAGTGAGAGYTFDLVASLSSPFAGSMQPSYWCDNAVQVFGGRVDIGSGIIIDSNVDYRLTFKLLPGAGFTYLCGRGSVLSYDGQTTRLGFEDTVGTWVPLLASGDALQREAAAQALGDLAKAAPDTNRVVPGLIKALGDETFEVRRNAAEALGRIGDPRAIQPLTSRADEGVEKDDWVRKVAAEALKRIAIHTASTAVAPTEPVHPNVKLVIRAAFYGDLPDGTKVEVTDKVRAMVKRDVLSVDATKANFGDPTNGTLKPTIVTVDLDLGGIVLKGLRADLHQQGNRITLPPGPLLKVYYKYGDGKTLCKDYPGGGDVTIPLPPMKLRVDYTFQGVDRSKTVDENDALTINDKGE